MQRNVFEAKAINKEIQLLTLADLHIGNQYCDEEYVKAMIDYIEMTPNAYFILNGDLIENTTKNSPASVFGDTLSPIEQVELICNYLKPIVKQGKCINATIGNHELRSQKENGLTPMDLIIANLSKYDEGLNDKYMPDEAYSFIRITNVRNHGKGKDSAVILTLSNQHGDGGGSTYNKLEKMNFIPADIRIRSHLHTCDIHPYAMYVPNYNNYDIKTTTSWDVSNGTTLRDGGYTRYKGYAPPDNIYPVISVKVVRHSYNKDGKRSDYYEKEITPIGRTKQWFLDQVRSKK